jgi:hypothetical protein
MKGILFFICWLSPLLLGAVEYGTIVFSELMIDPDPVVGLPAAEYVELYNRSDVPISLKGYTFYYGDKAYAFPDEVFGAGDYLVLCSKAASLLFSSDVPVLAFASFPTLLNTGKLMCLVSDGNEPVAYLDYSENWYGNGFKSGGGWSLECKDLNNLSGLGSNWTASTDSSGGTPGRENAVACTNADEVAPVFTFIYILSPTSIELHFSKFIHVSSLANALNYSVSPENTLVVKAAAGFPDARTVVLQLSDALDPDDTYTLRMEGLADVSGLPLNDTTCLFGWPVKPEVGSLQLNEILFNPVSGGCDYVEFVNTGKSTVDLSQVWLTNRNEAGIFNEGIRLSEKACPCVPGSYWLLSVSADSVCSAGHGLRIPHSLDLTRFPSLPDDVGNVSLLTTSAEVIDEMHYSDDMHFKLISDQEGVSLEKRNPNKPSGVASNWLSAASTALYGTPGFLNSQYRTDSVVVEGDFFVPQNWMTPDNDAQNDRITLFYNVPEASVGNVRIYDLSGKLVKTLANNELLAAGGSFLWDGTSDSFEAVSYGRYVLYAEAFTPTGKIIRKRMALTVLF